MVTLIFEFPEFKSTREKTVQKPKSDFTVRDHFLYLRSPLKFEYVFYICSHDRTGLIRQWWFIRYDGSRGTDFFI
jgi:hypothetical protein